MVSELRRRRPDVVVSISATTRAPRPGERDGVSYHFLQPSTFDRWIEDGRFLEWAEFGGHRYGTPWISVEAALEAGRPVILEIDVQGARQVRERIPGAVLIFLEPPTSDVLGARLEARGTDDPARVAERLRIAEWELAQRTDFDHVVLNEEVDEAVEAIVRILDWSPPAAPPPHASAPPFP